MKRMSDGISRPRLFSPVNDELPKDEFESEITKNGVTE